MANNRLGLKCDICGEERMIAKRFYGRYSAAENLVAGLNDWLSEHVHEESGQGCDHFSVVYEMAREI